MKLVTAFFLSFFYLLGGYDIAHATLRNGSICHAPALIIENAQVGGVNPNRDFLISTNDLSHENPYVISVEDENEENIIRRHVSLTGYFLAFSYEIISNHSYSSSSESLSFRTPDFCTNSCKYIFQRVLRI